MVGLESSRWASDGKPTSNGTSANLSVSTPAQRPSQRPTSRADELERHRRLLRRMRWKLPYLADSHHRATAPERNLPPDVRREMELMFKLDFFEYYVLLERALVHLLAVFGITVSRTGTGHSNGMPLPNSSMAYAHRFHANVLLALDQPSNPLHPILGRGDVKTHLAAAKELRNRWKDAEEHALLSVDKDAPETASPPPLSAYEIEQMLGSIFEAFDKAQEIAETAVQGTLSSVNAPRDPTSSTVDAMETETIDVVWESFPDAMEWEALS